MTDLWYDVTGSGSPVVLLHESLTDSRIWQLVVPRLSERHQVIRYDQRGYGRSPRWDGPYSSVDDLVGVMDAAGVAQGALVGLSRGGRIALDAALEQPERVSALVLVAAGLPGFVEVEGTPEQEARWEAAEQSGDVAAMAELDMEIWAPLGVDEKLRAMFLENAQASNSDDPAAESNAASRLGEVTARTLVITAARDVDSINEIGERLAREIPGAQRAVVEGADHMVPWRAPDELATLVLEFLDH